MEANVAHEGGTDPHSRWRMAKWMRTLEYSCSAMSTRSLFQKRSLQLGGGFGGSVSGAMQTARGGGLQWQRTRAGPGSCTGEGANNICWVNKAVRYCALELVDGQRQPRLTTAPVPPGKLSRQSC